VTHVRRSIFIATLVPALCWACPTSAQGAAAEALFEEGRKALAAGDLDTACARFRASDQIDPAPGTKANLADCEERRGRVATAWELNRTALGKLPAGDPRAPILKQRIAKLEGRLPKLVLTLAAGAPKETVVREGEATLGTSSTYGVALPLDPGVHHLEVSAPGRAPRTIEVTLAEGKSAEVTVEPGAVEAAPRAPAAPASSSASPGPWIVGGVGVAGIVVGAVAGVIVLSKKGATSACSDGPPPTCPTQDAVDAANAGRALGPVSTVGFVVGAAGLAAGGIWLGLRGGGKASSARFGFGPVVGGASWRVEGSW
jgi:hypothetical protein